MFEKILVPLDETQVSAGIIPVVTELAKKTGAEVVLLTVLDVESSGPTSGGIRAGAPSLTAGGQLGPVGAVGTPEPVAYQAGPYPSQVDEKAADDARHRLREFANNLVDEGVDSKSEVRFGEPGEVILSTASERGCDLIAMSTHAKSGLGRILMGSVTEEVIRGSGTPVLTIKPPEA